jgi:hypothetical protein
MSRPRQASPSAVIRHPFRDYAKRIQLCQYRRGPANATWEARYHVGGDWTGWASLGTETRDDALGQSIAKLTEREAAHAAGIPLPGRRKQREVNTVAEIAVTTIARLETERRHILATQPAKKAQKVVTKLNRIRAILVPALGERGIANLSVEDLERFRQGHTVRGRKPAKGTIGQINAAWLEILRDAIALGHLSKLATKRLIISNEGFSHGSKGAAFTRVEMEAIRAYMTDAWVADSGGKRIVMEGRYILRALISLMSCTGISAGLEVETLTIAQVGEVLDSNGRPALRIAIRKNQGKRAKDRIVWARGHDVWPVLQDMRALLAWVKANVTDEYRQNNPQGFLFCRPSDGKFPNLIEGFAAVLDKLDIRQDPVSHVNRTMYSCRHYFATESLMDGVPITMIAENLGNSERMIRDHYAHVITDLRSGQLTGSDRPNAAWLRQTGLIDRLQGDDHDSDSDKERAA